MKKTIVALVIANALTTTAAFAAGDAGTWYTGGKFGWSHYFDTNTLRPRIIIVVQTILMLTVTMSVEVFIPVIRSPRGWLLKVATII